MENIILTSIKNPLIKQVRKLHRSKKRQQQNLLIIEGTNSIAAAIQADYKLDNVFYTSGWQDSHQLLCRQIAQKGFKVQLVSPEVLQVIATTIEPDGIVAIAPRVSLLEPNIASVGLGVALERLQDPGNLGTIIRTAAATEVDGLWLSSDSVDVYSPKVLRASAGEWFKVPVATNQNLVQLARQQLAKGVQTIGTTAQAQKTYWEIDFTRPSLMFLGNEGSGLSEELLEATSEQVSIPLINGVESLNVAIATALLLYEARRQLSLDQSGNKDSYLNQ